MDKANNIHKMLQRCIDQLEDLQVYVNSSVIPFDKYAEEQLKRDEDEQNKENDAKWDAQERMSGE
jgi:hypothetical protein